MADLQVVESQATVLDLPPQSATLLAQLGEQLASSSQWWSGVPDTNNRSVISVVSLGADRYRVTFRDVVGVVRLPTCQIQVAPKIPLAHFLYLVSRSEISPRITPKDVSIARAPDLVEVLARWFMSATEDLLRLGLRSDYKTFISEQQTIRGLLFPCETMLEVLQGRPVAVCEYEELSDDAPLNRLVRGACERLSRLSILSEDTRGRARRAAYRMSDMGPVRPADFRVRVDRLTKAYSRVAPLHRSRFSY